MMYVGARPAGRLRSRSRGADVAADRDEIAMKCQKCDKPATFHITDLIDGKPNELHLCEECATSS